MRLLSGVQCACELLSRPEGEVRVFVGAVLRSQLFLGLADGCSADD
jgi:hypothetical protein